MEPGTILSIVELSLSVLKLGTKIALEFWPNRSDKVPDKLKRLNDRLQQFYSVVENIVQEPKGHNVSSSLVFQGADAIIETLTECDRFLRQYESALRDRALGGTSQRLVLLIGPDSSKIEDLDKRILSHYPELHLWEQKILSLKQDRTLSTLKELQASLTQIHLAPYPPSSSSHSYRTSSIPESPELDPSGKFDEFLYEATTFQISPQPGFPKSPSLGPSSRNPSLHSIPELPPAQVISVSRSPDVGIHENLTGRGAAPVMTHLAGRFRENAFGHSSIRAEPENVMSTSSQVQRAPQTRSPISPTLQFHSQGQNPSYSSCQSQGHLVTIRIGSQSYEFNSNEYTFPSLETDGGRIIEWSNTSGVAVRHFVPSTCNIPYTIPEDKKGIRVLFLPRNRHHQFEISRPDSEVQTFQDVPEYVFARKVDREAFQQRFRACDSLELIRALKIHNGTERDIAIKVHLKVWRWNDQDDRPTFSFAAHEIGHDSHHVEYVIRWFKKTPELRGDNKLRLKVNSKETNTGEDPAAEILSKRPSTIGSRMRRLSGGQLRFTDSASRSRSPVLYDCQGIEPPNDIRRLGYIEIEFKTQDLRDTFINACYKAHQLASEASRRYSTPSPVSQRSYSRPPSWTLGPNPTPYELEDSGRHELVGDSGAFEMDGYPGLGLPPPSVTAPWSPEETYFHNTSTLFASPSGTDHATFLGTIEDYDTPPHNREPG
ncbi:hypothetical protein F5Y04DRAFT_292762, partial [Hypomontagnella monticulosa]